MPTHGSLLPPCSSWCAHSSGCASHLPHLPFLPRVLAREPPVVLDPDMSNQVCARGGSCRQRAVTHSKRSQRLLCFFILWRATSQGMEAWQGIEGDKGNSVWGHPFEFPRVRNTPGGH